jgi:hypothetical protein
MKQRAAKTKRAAKPGAARKAGARTKQPAARKASTATKAAVTGTPKATPYVPAPLKGDGWPPFRYPLQ